MDCKKNEKDGICTDPNCPIEKPHCHLPRGGRETIGRSDAQTEKRDKNR